MSFKRGWKVTVWPRASEMESSLAFSGTSVGLQGRGIGQLWCRKEVSHSRHKRHHVRVWKR
jgi:hypothetical protein